MNLDIHQTTLPSGIRVISSYMPHLDSAAVGMWVGVGGRHESRKLSGVSHMIEHLLFKGTRHRSARQITQAIEGRGGYFNAFTQEESTCYYARISATYTRQIIELLTDMFMHPRFSEGDILKEKAVILEEIMMYRDQPHQLVQDVLGELLWWNHPLGRPLVGTPENVAAISREDILSFKERMYTGSNTVITLAGNVNHQRCVEVLERCMEGIPENRVRTPRKVDTSTVQRVQQVIGREIEQTHLALGARVFGRKDPRRYALKLISVILGENMSSRLFQSVRERYGLAYSVHSGCHLFEETGAIVISAGLDRSKTEKAFEVIIRECRKLKEKPVSKAELQRAKDYAVGQLQIGLESTSNQMLWLGENILAFKKIQSPDDAVRHLREVTCEDIQQVAGEIFQQQYMSCAMVVPQALASFKPAEMLKALDK